MNKNVLIAFGGAILIAILVALLMSAMLKGGKKEKQVAQAAPRVQIMVAAQDIGVGELLTDTNVKWKNWPEDAAFPGTIQRKGNSEKLADAAKGRAIRSIAMDEPVLKSALVSDEGGFMAARLKPGMRAFSIKTSANSMVAGFVNPGDFVDVILTYNIDVKASSADPALQAEMNQMLALNLNRRASETVLKNVKVLGIDQAAAVDAKTAAKVGKTITLEVDQRGAEILSLASEMGELSLSLRPLGDTNIADSGQPSVSDARISKINKELFREMSNLEESSGASRRNVRIYNGDNVMNLPTR